MKYGMMVSGVVCVLGGCVDGGAPAPASTDEPMVERTIVKLMPDGTNQLRSEKVSAAQVQREIAAREALAARGGEPSESTGEATQRSTIRDSCSDPLAMWIFDSDNHTLGTGLFSHEICFIRDPTTPVPACLDLQAIPRLCFVGGGCQNWAGGGGNWIGSYWAGRDAGDWLDSGSGADGGFSPWQILDNAWQDANVARAAYICFDLHH